MTNTMSTLSNGAIDDLVNYIDNSGSRKLLSCGGLRALRLTFLPLG